MVLRFRVITHQRGGERETMGGQQTYVKPTNIGLCRQADDYVFLAILQPKSGSGDGSWITFPLLIEREFMSSWFRFGGENGTVERPVDSQIDESDFGFGSTLVLNLWFRVNTIHETVHDNGLSIGSGAIVSVWQTI